MSNQQFHFFGSNLAEWKTSDSVADVLAYFKKTKQGCTLYYVPVPEKSVYSINFFRPVVDGTIFLGAYDSKGKLIPEPQHF